MVLTCESWSPLDCECHIHHKYNEGPGVPVGDSDGNLMTHCSPAEATVIRLGKHEARVVLYQSSGNAPALQGEMNWWARQIPYSESICPAHVGLTAGQTRYEVLRDESARHNLAVNIASARHPELADEDFSYEWTGQDDQRLLTLRYAPITRDPQTRQPISKPPVIDEPFIQAALDLQFGPGKVVLS